ncbi:MAG: tetratricopeptide repeat protein [Chlorobium sp.]|nr:MAG: tetratricopeptide repeat protein [Chlorobium sp.]
MNIEQPFDFQCDVIEQSHEIPVLADFWAEWCAPCRMLTPLLEKLAEKNSGRWKLQKINTGEYPDLAVRYKVKGIPNVKLFVKGVVVDEFSGALSEYQIEEWLKKAVPSPYEKEIALAADFVFQGKPRTALSLLEGVLQKEPDNLQALALLVRVKLFAHPDEALRLSLKFESEPEYAELAGTIRTLGRLIMLDQERLPDDEVRNDYLVATEKLRLENFDGALEAFTGIIRRNRFYDDDGSRKACIAIFRYLGEEHEISRKHRKAFDRAF